MRVNEYSDGYFFPDVVMRDIKLSARSKIVFVEIFNKSNFGENIFVLNRRDLCEACGISHATLHNCLKQLFDQKYFIDRTPDKNKILQDKDFEGLGYGSQTCEWCKVRTAVLHKHHHPIAKSSGGEETVSICPNCHHEFHFFEMDIGVNIKKL